MNIGTLNIDHPIALAPMEDVSDIPFRRICKEFGADIVYTEFTHSEALIRNVKRAVSQIPVTDAERPVAVQIYGGTEEALEEAADIAQQAGPDFIDINCGCWVKKIAMRGDGAGLLRDLKKFERVVQAVQRGTTLPVTVKTRLGWDADNFAILDVARMLEANGVDALTVHCRTRKQGYTGTADWSWLPRIKEVSSVPLIANGDIETPEDLRTVFDLGADGAMIGRGAIKNPWIFRQAKHYLATGNYLQEPTLEERIELCIRHLKDHVAHRGERWGVLSFRKFYAHYLRNAHLAAKLRASLMKFVEVPPIEDTLRRYLDDDSSSAVA